MGSPSSFLTTQGCTVTIAPLRAAVMASRALGLRPSFCRLAAVAKTRVRSAPYTPLTMPTPPYACIPGVGHAFDTIQQASCLGHGGAWDQAQL